MEEIIITSISTVQLVCIKEFLVSGVLGWKVPPGPFTFFSGSWFNASYFDGMGFGPGKKFLVSLKSFAWKSDAKRK
jgi:hypothetical protein